MLMVVEGGDAQAHSSWRDFRLWFADLSSRPLLYNGFQLSRDVSSPIEISETLMDDFRDQNSIAGFGLMKWSYVVEADDDTAVYLMLRFKAYQFKHP